MSASIDTSLIHEWIDSLVNSGIYPDGWVYSDILDIQNKLYNGVYPEKLKDLALAFTNDEFLKDSEFCDDAKNVVSMIQSYENESQKHARIFSEKANEYFGNIPAKFVDQSNVDFNSPIEISFNNETCDVRENPYCDPMIANFDRRMYFVENNGCQEIMDGNEIIGITCMKPNLTDLALMMFGTHWVNLSRGTQQHIASEFDYSRINETSEEHVNNRIYMS